MNDIKGGYQPRPVDTTKITLPEDLQDLVERMAENVHEIWAKTRLEQGWKYGKERNDIEKTHPCLVAYDELPESEKEYDRNTAVETVKLILSLGFKIEKNVEDR